jgi:hypothetical protein
MAMGAFLVAGCSGTPPIPSVPVSSAGAPGASAYDADRRAGEVHALSARGLISALSSAGFPVPNALDTTVQDCSAAGCQQSITTDTLRVRSFATTAQAQQYAADRGLYQVASIVVSFAPPLPAAEQARYRAEIQKLVA